MKSAARSNWALPLLLLLILFVTSACALVSTTPPPVNSYCAVAKPIRYNSKLDSPKTVAAAEAHNSIWVCLCQSDCPATAPSTK